MTIKEFLASRAVGVPPYDFVRFNVTSEEVEITVQGAMPYNNKVSTEFTYDSPMRNFLDSLDALFSRIEVKEDGEVVLVF